jgi:hypothetical protein
MPCLCSVKATLKPDSDTRVGDQKASYLAMTGPITLLLQFAAAAGGAQQRRGND